MVDGKPLTHVNTPTGARTDTKLIKVPLALESNRVLFWLSFSSSPFIFIPRLENTYIVSALWSHPIKGTASQPNPSVVTDNNNVVVSSLKYFFLPLQDV